MPIHSTPLVCRQQYARSRLFSCLVGAMVFTGHPEYIHIFPIEGVDLAAGSRLLLFAAENITRGNLTLQRGK